MVRPVCHTKLKFLECFIKNCVAGTKGCLDLGRGVSCMRQQRVWNGADGVDPWPDETRLELLARVDTQLVGWWQG